MLRFAHRTYACRSHVEHFGLYRYRFLFSSVSVGSNSIVGRINLHIFHAEVMANAGWWLYTVIRAFATVLIVWAIYRFPKQDGIQGEPKRSSDNLFDPLMGLRAMACLIVLMGHFFFIFFPFTSSEASTLSQMSLVGSPWAGVWLFFALSGYLMGKGFVRGRYRLDEALLLPWD
jgi:hypothetical protein